MLAPLLSCKDLDGLTSYNLSVKDLAISFVLSQLLTIYNIISAFNFSLRLIKISKFEMRVCSSFRVGMTIENFIY